MFKILYTIVFVIASSSVSAESFRVINTHNSQMSDPLFEIDLAIVSGELEIEIEVDNFTKKETFVRAHMHCEWSVSAKYNGKKQFYNNMETPLLFGTILRNDSMSSSYLLHIMDFSETIFSKGEVFNRLLFFDELWNDDYIYVTKEQVENGEAEEQLKKICNPRDIKGISAGSVSWWMESMFFEDNTALSSKKILDQSLVKLWLNDVVINKRKVNY